MAERAHYSKTYGINRESEITLLDPFDVTEQVPQDVMHVLLEGVVPIEIGLLLRQAVVEDEAITLAVVNQKIASFPYSYFESDTKPSTIPQSSVQNGDLTGKQTGKKVNCYSNHLLQYYYIYSLLMQHHK